MILIPHTFPEEEFVCDIYPILCDMFVHRGFGKGVVLLSLLKTEHVKFGGL